MLKYFAVFLVPVLYFFVMWTYPWESIQWLSFMEPFSPNICFDIFISITGLLILKQNVFIGKMSLKGTSIRAGFTAAVAVFCILLSNILGLYAPFHLLDSLFLHVVIIAPILEELVFRGVFFGLGEKTGLDPKINVPFNTFLFSFSHFSGLWYVPKEAYTFIYFQLVYTLVLGYFCSQSRQKTKGIVEPILLHMVFNIVFYVAVITKKL